jgi:hypothetical protein
LNVRLKKALKILECEESLSYVNLPEEEKAMMEASLCLAGLPGRGGIKQARQLHLADRIRGVAAGIEGFSRVAGLQGWVKVSLP